MGYREELELFKQRKKELGKIIKAIRIENVDIAFKLMMGDTQMYDNLFVISVSPTYINDKYLKQSREDLNAIINNEYFKKFCEENNVRKEFKKKQSQIYNAKEQRYVYVEIYRCIFKMDVDVFGNKIKEESNV